MEVRSVEAIVRALNEARVQYLIVGGLAVNAQDLSALPAMSTSCWPLSQGMRRLG